MEEKVSLVGERGKRGLGPIQSKRFLRGKEVVARKSSEDPSDL